MSRLTILTMISLLLSGLIFFRQKDPSTIAVGEGLVVKKEWLKINDKPATPAEDIRPADQTFLTFPEWFLVFSPEEQADYFSKHTSTGFPFTDHIAQMWESYRIVNNQIKEDFPVNTGYHFMIWVIASSTTVEYSAKALYETLVGRLTDTRNVNTEEDQFNATFARAYVNFIKDRPWYEFDFKNQLSQLWSTSFWGAHGLRKLERKYLLTSELLVKWGYGKLIGLGTATVYDEALPTTTVLVDTLPKNFPSERILKTFPDQSTLIKLPRYDQFNFAATELARAKVEFREIAGNNSAILLTILTAVESNIDYSHTQVIFIQPIESNKTLKRIALATPVTNLSNLLRSLEEDRIQVEHIFDF